MLLLNSMKHRLNIYYKTKEKEIIYEIFKENFNFYVCGVGDDSDIFNGGIRR